MEQGYEINYNKCWWGREKNYLNYKDHLLQSCERDGGRYCDINAKWIVQLDQFEEKMEYKRFGMADWPYYTSTYWAAKGMRDTTRDNEP